MKITIRGKNFKVQERTQDYATQKLERLERYMPNIREVFLELQFQDNKRGEDFSIAQITLTHERGAILRTEEKVGGITADSLEAAISAAVDKMHRRIRRFRGKRDKRRKGRGRYAATLEELELVEELPDEDEMLVEEEIEYTEPEIVRRKEIDVFAMTEEEAIEQMELLGHTFFMFKHGETGAINVLYRRKSGDYGVLVPSAD